MKFSMPIHVLDNLKIRYKLFVACFLVTVIPVCGIGYFSFHASKSSLTEQSKSMISQMQQNTITNIDKRLENYRYLGDTLYKNQKLQQYVSGTYIDYLEEYDFVVSFIDPVLQSMLEATGKGICVSLIRYSNEKSEVLQYNFEGILKSTTQKDRNYLSEGSKFYQVINLNRMKDIDWFIQAKGKTPDYTWAQVGKDKEYNNISLLREMVNYSEVSQQKIGMLRVTVPYKDVFGTENIKDMTKEGFYLIFDPQNHLLSVEAEKRDFYNTNRISIDKSLNQSGSGESVLTGSYIFLGNSIISGKYKIVSVFPIENITDRINNIRNITLFYCGVSVPILLIITFLLSSSFSGRIIKLSRQMDKFKKGDFTVKIKDIKGDELGFLGSVFNDMTEQINILIKDNYQANIDKKDIMLKVLQAQINPHFLYNSLSAVSRLAEIGENESIVDMVMALTTFYRMTLNKGKDIITISDELEQVKSYIDVFKIRKGERFTVLYDIDESVLEFYTVKVILQPFVENIFEHAFFSNKKLVNIVVSAKKQDDHIVFTIIDDGIGIRRENLKNLFTEEKESEKTGYGIKNVDERIKLHFGNQYGVRVASISGAGTTVSITVPVLLQENIYRHNNRA